MNAHLTKIVTKSWFHERPSCLIERPARRGESTLDERDSGVLRPPGGARSRPPVNSVIFIPERPDGSLKEDWISGHKIQRTRSGNPGFARQVSASFRPHRAPHVRGACDWPIVVASYAIDLLKRQDEALAR